MMYYGCHMLILSLALVQCSNINELYITPSIPNDPCPVIACITLSEFSHRQIDNIANGNLTLIFLAGNYTLNVSLTIGNLIDFKIIPYESRQISEIAVNIFCEGPVRLDFYAIQNILFHGIQVVGCEHFVFKYVEILVLSSVTHCSFNGLQLTQVSAKVIDCSFNAHFVTHYFNESVSGGAIAAYHSNVSISNSTFEDNCAEKGGAVFLDFESNIRILNCFFVRNEGNSGGVIFSGRNSTLIIYNVSFIDNNSHNGGVLYLIDTSVTIIRDCVFVRNRASTYGMVECYMDGIL